MDRILQPGDGRGPDQSSKVNDDPYTDKLDFDWSASLLRHTRVNIEVEVDDFAKSIYYKNFATGEEGCLSDLDLSGGERVFLYDVFVWDPLDPNTFNTHPIEVGINRIEVTPYIGTSCDTGPGPVGAGETSVLKLTVSFKGRTVCNRAYIIGFQYTDFNNGQLKDLIPFESDGFKHCIANGDIQAMTIGCLSGFTIVPVQFVKFRLLDRKTGIYQRPGGKYKRDKQDEPPGSEVFSKTFNILGKGNYTIDAIAKLSGSGKKTKLEKNFQTLRKKNCGAYSADS